LFNKKNKTLYRYPMANDQRLITLLNRYLDGTATAEEVNEVEQWYAGIGNEGATHIQATTSDDETIREMLQNIRVQIAVQQGRESKVIQMGSRERRPLRYVSVAAAVLLFLIAGTVFLLLPHKQPVELASIEQRYRNDVLPNSKSATVTLADGTIIPLDKDHQGKIGQQAGTTISYENGVLVYHAEQNPGSSEKLINIVSAPRGGGHRMIVLPDSTKVWLNAASSLQFLASFSGNERRVELTGEAYFEVAKNKAKPFYVAAKGTETKVLGTHFNVQAYPDETAIATTLVEGSVQVTIQNATRVITPGQQAQMLGNGSITTRQVDSDEVTAWKDGFFNSGEPALKM
jgi:transmembrane sensor